MTTTNAMNQELALTQKHRNITKWIRFAPNLDTAIAFASLFLMILAYYAATHWLISQQISIIGYAWWRQNTLNRSGLNKHN